MEAFLAPVPNVIAFQFNPETITHKWSGSEAFQSEITKKDGTNEDVKKKTTNWNPLAVSGYPGESFSFKIAMSAGDSIADGNDATAALASTSGLYTRLAALEMLLYPVSTKTTGFNVAGKNFKFSTSDFTGGVFDDPPANPPTRDVPALQVPTVLFIWGPARIIPVRVKSLTITETIYDTLLNPIDAEADIELDVLTPDELPYVNGPLKRIAQGAYLYSRTLRQLFAAANLANTTDSVIGLVS
jgi:hypothetical protein